MNSRAALLDQTFAEGYRVDVVNGRVFGKNGCELKGRTSQKERYELLNLAIGSRRLSIRKHKLLAYSIFGAAALRMCVRHLDGNAKNNQLSNLALGSHADNEYDKPKSVRIRSAKSARAAQPVRPFNALLTEDQASAIRDEFNCYRYGVSSSTISLIGKGGS